MEQKHSQQNQRETLETLIRDYYEKMMKYRPDSSYDTYEGSDMDEPPKNSGENLDLDRSNTMDIESIKKPMEITYDDDDKPSDDILSDNQKKISDAAESLPEYFGDWSDEYTPVSPSGKSKLSDLVSIEWMEDLANEFAKSLFHLRIATIDDILDSLYKADPLLRKMVEERLRKMIDK